MVSLHLGEALTRYTDGDADFTLAGGTVAEVLETLFAQHPDVRERVVDGQGAFRRHLALFHNGESVRGDEVMARTVADGDELEIIAAMAGGT